MITTAIINLAYFLINGLISFFPVGTGFPSAAHDAAIALGGYLGILSPLIPTSTLLTCLTLVLTVELAIFGFKTLKWVISHIPWIGGKGN